MEDRERIRARVRELGARAWDVPAIEARYQRLLQDGIAPRRLDQEDVVFGRYLDARASAENMAAFQRELGYAKCALPAGIAARLAAEIIIESMAREHSG
jgi:hypothetical protein